MESSAWAKFCQFIKSSLQEKFKAFMPGVCMGFIGAQHILWIGVSVSLVTYIFKFIGTVLMAFGSGLATSYAAYLIDRFKTKRNESPKPQKKREKGKKTA